ncbi:MAG: PPC domain-containing protein, partial [Planctomycetes bacterium]|nr:PPC domain-containing protein [Planctomycetota bacterium]
EITIGGSLGTAPVHGWCSHQGVAISLPEKGTKLSIKIAADAQPGLCWIRLYNAEGASALRPFVIGTLPDVAEKEPNNDIGQAQQLPSTQVVVNGVLSATGDVDAFAVPLEQGQTVVASIDANHRLGSPMDAVLQVVSARGFVLDQNDDAHGFDPQISFTAKVKGTYIVRVFAFPAKPNSTIRLAGASSYIYRLTLTTGPFVDHTVPMSLARSDARSVRLHGWNIPEKLRELPISVPAEASKFVVHHAELANTLELRIDSHASVGEHEPNPPKQPEKISLPQTLTGRIDPPGDTDAFAFNAKKGERLSFHVDSRSLGHPLDAVLVLTDAGGKQLSRNDDQSRGQYDATLDFTVPQDGVYRVVVSDLFGHGGLRYAYRLTMAAQRADFVLSTAADKFVLTVGQPLKIPVTVTRRRGFGGEIEITAEGLPEAVSITSIKSILKSKTEKTVELVLTAAEEVKIEQPFRIVGRSKIDSQSLVRAASSPLAELTQKTTDFWLTLRKSEKAKPATEKKP